MLDFASIGAIILGIIVLVFLLLQLFKTSNDAEAIEPKKFHV